MFGKGGPGIGAGGLALMVSRQVTGEMMREFECEHARALAKARIPVMKNTEMKNTEPSIVGGTSLLDLTGFGHVGVVTSKRGNGQIMVIAHPRASKAQWDRAWDALPDVEVEEFDYHIRPDGTEVYTITPGYPHCDQHGCCRCL